MPTAFLSTDAEHLRSKLVTATKLNLRESLKLAYAPSRSAATLQNQFGSRPLQAQVRGSAAQYLPWPLPYTTRSTAINTGNVLFQEASQLLEHAPHLARIKTRDPRTNDDRRTPTTLS